MWKQKDTETCSEDKELLEDEQLKELRSKDDKDVRFGYKTVTSTFYGYKNRLAMIEERLIVGINVTDGGAPDGQELLKLIEKAKDNGIKVKEVIGDMAYVSDDNLEVLRRGSVLIKMPGCCSVLQESFPCVWKRDRQKMETLI